MTVLPFDQQCEALGLPVPVAEYRFHAPRRWRFDWAWPACKVAMEVQGGIFTSGRHSRGAALVKEHEKLNTAACDGWRLLYVTPTQIRTGEAADWVNRCCVVVGSLDR